MRQENRMSKVVFEKSLNTLIGIIDGIQSDNAINTHEIQELQNWCSLQGQHRNRYPFKELIPIVLSSLEDGILTEDEIEDIKFMCKIYINKNPYFDVVTSDIQTLQGIMQGILSDGKVNEKELGYLKQWLEDCDHLESTYPYDEVYSLIHSVLKDGRIDAHEEKLLIALFSDFIDTKVSYNINKSETDQLRKEMKISGICALGPNVEITNKRICFTGESSKMDRSKIEEIVINKGGRFDKNVLTDTDFLIVGGDGSPYWAFACYGRKIEKAINLRKQGKKIVIAHEVDFWDAIV